MTESGARETEQPAPANKKEARGSYPVMLTKWLSMANAAVLTSALLGCSGGTQGSGLPDLATTGDSPTSGEMPTSTASGDVGETTSAPKGDCCEVNATGGCADASVELCVCGAESSCCEEAWTADCVDLAVSSCVADCDVPAGSTGEPGGTTTGDAPGTTGSGESSSTTGMPTLSCGELAAQEGFVAAACESNGNGACGGEGTPTTDCDFCCDACPQADTCGNLAMEQGWGQAACESNGNGACGGAGTPTCDCDYCCEV